MYYYRKLPFTSIVPDLFIKNIIPAISEGLPVRAQIGVEYGTINSGI